MPKADRHKKDRRPILARLNPDDFRRFDRLRAGCKTDQASFLKLLELAEAGKQESEAVRNKLRTSES
jgi:hypothetical protein